MVQFLSTQVVTVPIITVFVHWHAKSLALQPDSLMPCTRQDS